MFSSIHRSVGRFFSFVTIQSNFPPSTVVALTVGVVGSAFKELSQGIGCLKVALESGFTYIQLRNVRNRISEGKLSKLVYAVGLPALCMGIQSVTSAARTIKCTIIDGAMPYVFSHFNGLRTQTVLSNLSDLQGRVARLQGDSREGERSDQGQIADGWINPILTQLHQQTLFRKAQKQRETGKGVSANQAVTNQLTEDLASLEQIRESLKKIKPLPQNSPAESREVPEAQEGQPQREKVKGVCQQFCQLLSDERKQRFSILSHDQLLSLREIRDQILPLLKTFAQDQEIPYDKLSQIGLRDHDFMSIARGVHWSTDDGEFLPIKFAEQAIFTRQDLQDKVLKHLQQPYDREELQRVIIQVLNGKNVSLEPGSNFSKNLRWLISKVARVATTILLVAYHGLSFHTVYMYPSYASNPIALLDAFYRGWSGKPCFVYPRRFIVGDLEAKFNWVLDAGAPVAVFTQTFAYVCYHSQEGIRSFPKHIYKAYCGG